MNEEFAIPPSFFDPPEMAAVPAAASLPAEITTDTDPWPPKLAFDVALGLDSAEALCERYDLDLEQLTALICHPLFQKQVASHRGDIQANGVGFKAKARAQAEIYLREAHDIIMDRSIAPSIRMDAIKSVVRWGELEPKTGAASGPAGASTTRLVFQWGDGSGQCAVEVKNEAGD